ncbi:EB domain-containing protein [Delftia sp.]|uniref:EB domain-containing protein n=1 Tax=Delftia sp. TaxID=1886637 RepID=UPI0002E7FCD3|nr:EB domain-containing protein [Delftia sp.]MPT53179.1 hypothetical protein [Delftia sp.]
MAYLYRLSVSARFLVALLLTLTCCAVHAGITMPLEYSLDGLRWFPTKAAACNYDFNDRPSEDITRYGIRITSVDPTCDLATKDNPSWVRGSYRTQKAACPANSTQSGDECVCKAGFAELGNQCVPDTGGGECVANAVKVDGQCDCKAGFKRQLGGCFPDEDAPCAGLGDFCSGRQGWASQFRSPGQGADFVCQAAENFNSGGGSTPAFPNCSKGCLVSTGTTVTVKDDAGKSYTTGNGKYVGSTCDPNVINKLNEGKEDEKEVTPPDSKDPGKCNGQSGTVNGVSVCLPYGEAEGDKTTRTETNSDGSKTRTDTKTTCTGSTCTTETKVTKIGPDGNSTGGSTTVTQVPKDDYCSRNPGSSVCKALDPKGPGGGSGNGSGNGNGNGDGDDDEDKSSFGGSCSGGWSCEGDAIQCAIAKEQHKRSCELFQDTDNEAYKLYAKEKDKEGSVLDGLKGNKDVDVSQYVNGGDDFIGSGSCPADRKISFSYGEVTIPYSSLCPYISMFGVVIVVCAGIAGARIITRRDS